MAGLGWIDFNPTPSRPLIARPGDDSDLLAAFGLIESGGGLFDEVPFDEDADFEALLASLGVDLGTEGPPDADLGSDGGIGSAVARVAGWILALAAAGLVLILAGVTFWERPYRNLPPSTRRWGKLSRLATWTGVGTAPTRTAHETAREWTEALWPRPLDTAPLAAAFSRERYGRPGHIEPPDDAEELDRALRASPQPLPPPPAHALATASTTVPVPVESGARAPAPGRQRSACARRSRTRRPAPLSGAAARPPAAPAPRDRRAH